MKMKGVYESNPALGDPMTIESQLRENTQNLERLRLELHKFQRSVSFTRYCHLLGRLRSWSMGELGWVVIWRRGVMI